MRRIIPRPPGDGKKRPLAGGQGHDGQGGVGMMGVLKGMRVVESSAFVAVPFEAFNVFSSWGMK